MAAVAVSAYLLVSLLLLVELGFRDLPEQPQVLDDAEVGGLHLLNDFHFNQTHLGMVLD